MNHFFALPFPPPIQTYLFAMAAEWRQQLSSNIQIQWYAPADYHITLKFLGDVPETKQEELVQVIIPIAAAIKPFPIALAPCGAFPNLKNPSVLWGGIERDDTLTHLATLIDHVMGQCGFPEERRPYHPHVTVARCRRSTHREKLTLPEQHERPFPNWNADRFALLQTLPPDRRRNGRKARYNTVHTFPLGTQHSFTQNIPTLGQGETVG